MDDVDALAPNARDEPREERGVECDPSRAGPGHRRATIRT
jgi:hypothetical protein